MEYLAIIHHYGFIHMLGMILVLCLNRAVNLTASLPYLKTAPNERIMIPHGLDISHAIYYSEAV
jgi:hypothetical protein